MKPVTSQRIRHIAPLPTRHRDLHLVETDNLRRGNDVFRPVPVREPQFEGGVYPLCFVGSCVRRGDLLGMLIDDLLQTKRERKKKKKKKKEKVITSTCTRRLKRLTSTSMVYGLCQVGNNVEPCVQYPAA